MTRRSRFADRVAPAWWQWLFAGICLSWLCGEPALANKFEAIGSGLSGSSSVKREWVQNTFVVGGVLCVLGAVLAVAVPHRNALYLNYSNWKASAVVLTVLASLCFAVAALV